jgi:ATP-dependent RNA helicase DDX19/DBP5
MSAEAPAQSESAAPSLADRITHDAPAGEVSDSQADGAPKELNGSGGLQEPEYDVEVKLADIQGDVNSPLHSVKTFEELGLYVFILS